MSKNENTDDFEVVLGGQPDSETIVITSEEMTKRWLKDALAAYDPGNLIYSAYLNDGSTTSTLSTSLIASLGQDAQSNLENLRKINDIIRSYINTNDLIGMVVQAITSNINTKMRLSYKNFSDARNKGKKLEKAKQVLRDFNAHVNIGQFIRDSVQITFTEGNYASVLRNNGENWQIDWLPLTIIENSGYESNGNPVLLINIDELKSALNKSMIKTKKGKFLFFRDVAEEVEATYPKEVSDALHAKEKYAVLDANYTGMVRINNYGRRYGLSPIFRALSPTLMLDAYRTADESAAKSKAKKIIHQVMREKCLGASGDRKAFEEMAYSHDQLMRAWKNNTVIVTTNPCVEKIVYVEPKTEDISAEKINIYRNEVLSSLGVAFLASDRSQTASTANINLSQLLKCINSISEQTERIIERYYRVVLDSNGIDAEYSPAVEVIDSELLEMDLRMELSKLLYTTLSTSRETAFGLVGLNIDDERVKREKEEADGLSDVFRPYPTSYNSAGDDPGRPPNSEDTDKQSYDEEYDKTR